VAKAYTEWNYDTKESDNFMHKSKHHHLGIRTDWRIMKPKLRGWEGVVVMFTASFISGVITEHE
jgi:hypothetical protein